MDGIEVLQAVTMAREPIGSRQIAHRLSLEPTRANRLLKTLAAMGIIQQTVDRKYTAGAGIHVLAAQSLYASGLIRRALPVLESLHDTGLTVALGVLWRDSVCYLYHGRRGMSPSDALGTTGLFPAKASGIGRVLTATPRSRIRRQGWAFVPRDNGGTLAVPIGTPPYASLALAGDLSTASINKHLPRLEAAAATIGSEP